MPPPPFRVPDDLVTHGLEFIPDGLVAAVGAGAEVRFVNSRAERITGLAAADLLGRDVREALPLQDLEGRSWWDVSNPWEGLATRTGHRERLLVLPSGREVLVTAKYVRDAPGEPVGAVVLGLRDAETRRRADDQSAALLTTVAHELRSPLTGVKGFSSTLLRNWERFTDDQKRLMLETIEADADRVTRLITELLDVSRINVGRLTVHALPVDLRPRLEAQVERRVASGAQREHFVVDVPEDVTQIWADPDRLEQVVANLVENAVRHGAGTVRLAGRRSVLDGRPAVDLLVSDDGEGIASEHRELVFSRFWQGGAKHGTGLGLYLVRGLVEAHGGTVRAEVAPGGGALMRATFPDGE
ncbi:MAG TPA: ATP-binding protein [Ornithinibacter sp.]|nr:ATP-binding protein [Ornithinibacter sp.]